MKIKFIKDFKYPEVDISAGAVRNSEGYHLKDEVEEWFQWLIDNGFAKEVKEPEWVRKQIKEVHSKNIHINYKVVKAFYLPVGEWTSEHKTAFRMEPGDVAGFVGYDEDVIGYINQMVKLGYIEVENNPNIVWDDEKCD